MSATPIADTSVKEKHIVRKRGHPARDEPAAQLPVKSAMSLEAESHR